MENQKIEINLLIESIYLKYGIDFRGYSEASLKRRILKNLAFSGLKSISELQSRILKDNACFEKLLLDLSINVTEMFRDPQFYKAVREAVVPYLRKKSFIKVWHAGCASGEEVYSLAILFHEEGLGSRTRVYATDFNEKILIAAKNGIYSLEKMKTYTMNYHKAGGKSSFGDYYTSRNNDALISQSLKKNILFSRHNLVSDGSFGEMDLILCRNVMIYFNRDLQDKVFQLFKESLSEGCFLCLGAKESLRYSTCSDDFEDVVSKEKIYRKKITGCI